VSSARGPEVATARIVNVQRMSTEDGPGIRTTVFLKGCSLACLWCHNPESLAMEPEIVWNEWKCIHCDGCNDVCEENALLRLGAEVCIERDLCTGGTACANACPATAIERIGTERDVDDLVAEVVRDRAFFEASGGGVTISGGEPGVQVRFVTAFLARLRALGIHTALDTCGMCSELAIDEMSADADLVLYDLKEIDSERHRAFTGRPNERILANLLELAARMRRDGRPRGLWIRTPLIPGATATEANIRGIGRFIADHLADVVARWELCAFNNLAADKYRRLGRVWDFENVELMSRDELAKLGAVASGSGVDSSIVVVTGPVRVECEREPTPMETAHAVA
jgi:pyruvate formate lyase activating enzyme